MAIDNKTKRKELLAQLRELPPQNRAEDVSALLEARRRGEKRRPSRICGDLLPFRYAKDREVDLGDSIVSISVFANLAHYLSKQDVLALVRDASLFEKAKESLKDEKLPSSWSDCLREWSTTNPELGLEFYCEIRGMKANPRKRGTDTPAPEPKRHCVILPETRDDGAQDHPPPANVGHVSEQPKSGPSVSGAISTNVTTPPSASGPGTQQDLGRVADNTIPVDQSQPADTGDRETRKNYPALTPEAQKKIMTMTLSRCHVVVYPVEVFSELIRQAKQDVCFYRQDAGAHSYRSSGLGPSAGQFYIQASQELLKDVGQLHENGDDFVVPLSLVTRLFAAGGSSYATSIFWPTRGNITHIRKGCDVVWESAPAWIPFLNHLRSKRANIPKLSLLHTMLLSYPAGKETRVSKPFTPLLALSSS
ncbi:hypothetical protein CDEST_15630 [Colletotrichum destructivum]|uniref:Uncharacterized protein n=1 Tax=Colletotrichum destructivum TaxID=34406 RepID=A0AAX4J590_9PEZI|nr:hypothetical protein CDEST_15630 [Colletotrichum destructivum]